MVYLLEDGILVDSLTSVTEYLHTIFDIFLLVFDFSEEIIYR